MGKIKGYKTHDYQILMTAQDSGMIFIVMGAMVRGCEFQYHL